MIKVNIKLVLPPVDVFKFNFTEDNIREEILDSFALYGDNENNLSRLIENSTSNVENKEELLEKLDKEYNIEPTELIDKIKIDMDSLKFEDITSEFNEDLLIFRIDIYIDETIIYKYMDEIDTLYES